MSKTKKYLLIIGCIIVFGISCFCAGRFIRLDRATKSGDDLKQTVTDINSGLSEAGDSANTIGTELNSLRERNAKLESDLSDAQSTVRSLSTLKDECIGTLNAGDERINTDINIAQRTLESTVLILRIAQIKAEQNERTIAELNELLGRDENSSSKQ